jgi:hypothetical protein
MQKQYFGRYFIIIFVIFLSITIITGIDIIDLPLNVTTFFVAFLHLFVNQFEFIIINCHFFISIIIRCNSDLS